MFVLRSHKAHLGGKMLNVAEVSDPETNTISFTQRAEELELERQKKIEAEEQAKKSPFTRWTQYNNEHTREMIWLAMNHPRSNAILYFLVDQMDQYNAVMCSYKVIEEVFDVSIDTVRRALKVLKEHGFIAVLKSGSSNVYAVNDNVFWKSWGKNKRYSKFPANVILSLSEQEAGYQEKKIAFEKLKEVSLKKSS
jgi:Fe2+ or Zn2+ uptake regulation protein